jgi:hypothetical protein
VLFHIVANQLKSEIGFSKHPKQLQNDQINAPNYMAKTFKLNLKSVHVAGSNPTHLQLTASGFCGFEAPIRAVEQNAAVGHDHHAVALVEELI